MALEISVVTNNNFTNVSSNPFGSLVNTLMRRCSTITTSLLPVEGTLSVLLAWMLSTKARDEPGLALVAGVTTVNTLPGLLLLQLVHRIILLG